MKQRQAGDSDTDLAKLVSDRFLKSRNAYDDAMNAKNLAAHSGMQKILYFKYARLILDCRLFFRNYLKRSLPGDLDSEYREKVLKLLSIGKNDREKAELAEKLEAWDKTD
jgi:hypothetical protein